jgi:TRAP-type mannitol/chloroaromatic compound transport system substrate-binding protein
MIDRRRFLHTATVMTAGFGLGACSGRGSADNGELPELEWDMPTSWPTSLATLFGAAEVFADEVAALTGGRFRITPRAGGELVPALDVLPSVESGDFPIGHSTAYYYTDKAEFTAFGTGLPFGLTTRQQNAWLYEGGGLELLQRFYRERFGVIQFPAGNTGCQMGGWFKRKIDSVDDLRDLRMRIPGLGARVMRRLGVDVQEIAPGDILEALRTGTIDAAEWSGPYDDLTLGLPEVAEYYYYPGWWDTGPSVEIQINGREWTRLPDTYRQVIQAAAFKANMLMTARYDTLNPQALAEIGADENVTVLPFPDDILVAARDSAFALFDELAAADPDFRSLLDSWDAYRQSASAWFALAEASMLNLAGRTT